MKFRGVQLVVSVALVVLLVDYGAAFGLLDGLGLLQSYYGALPMAPAPALAPAPGPAPPPLPLTYMHMVLPPPVAAPPPPALPPPMVPCAPPEPKCSCGCVPHHPNCLAMIKPYLQAKLLNLKKKLIEKKLTQLLASCAQFNSHLYAKSC